MTPPLLTPGSVHLRRGRSALCALIAIAFAACGGSSSETTAPKPKYTMPLTLATVSSAVDLLTTGTDTVPVQCTGTLLVDCPGGVAGPVVTISRVRVLDSIVTLAPGVQYTYSAYVTLTSTQDIPVSVPSVGDCGLHLDTSPGNSPTVRVFGGAYFRSSVQQGPLDELALTIGLDGLEAADISFTGGTVCQVANATISLYLAPIAAALQGGTTILLCAGSGPGRFVVCPNSPAAAERSRDISFLSWREDRPVPSPSAAPRSTAAAPSPPGPFPPARGSSSTPASA